MDHPHFIVCSFIVNSKGLKRVYKQDLTVIEKNMFSHFRHST